MHDPTLRYTYVDGKSCVTSNRPKSPGMADDPLQHLLRESASYKGSASTTNKHRAGGNHHTAHESGDIELLVVSEPPVSQVILSKEQRIDGGTELIREEDGAENAMCFSDGARPRSDSS